MIFADKPLSQRLERAEAFACAEFAIARRHLSPQSHSQSIECAGTTAVFDGVDSPATQTFGLGLHQPLTEEALGQIERFFLEHGAPVMHEVSPYAGPEVLEMLCRHGYLPFEISNVLYQPVRAESLPNHSVAVRIAAPDEMPLWNETSARAWSAGHPELADFIRETGAVAGAREHTVCFLAEVDGQVGATGVLSLHDGVALFGGAATVPELRCRGLQGALLAERMRYAAEHQCDLALMVTEAGSNSQRNAQRKGFQVAYTRFKWRLSNPETTPS